LTAGLTGPYVASAALLGLAGVAKLVRPTDTAGALRAAGLTGKKWPTAAQHAAVRVGAAIEVGVAAAALAAPGPMPAALVAASYGAFTVFVIMALQRDWPLSSCGCFGRPDTPPAYLHALLDGAAAAIALAWAVDGPRRVAAVFAHQPWQGVPLGLAAAVICALAYLSFTYPLGRVTR
jgi:hypothetical protein